MKVNDYYISLTPDQKRKWYRFKETVGISKGSSKQEKFELIYKYFNEEEVPNFSKKVVSNIVDDVISVVGGLGDITKRDFNDLVRIRSIGRMKKR